NNKCSDGLFIARALSIMLSAIGTPAMGFRHEAAMHHLYVLLARIALSLVLAADGWERLAAGGSGLALLIPALQLLASAAVLAGAWSRTAAMLLAALVVTPALALLDMAGPEQVLGLGWS